MKLKKFLALLLAALMLLAVFAGCSVKKAGDDDDEKETVTSSKKNSKKDDEEEEEEDDKPEYYGVLEAYFEAFEDEDEDAIKDLVYPPLLELYGLYNENAERLVEDLDSEYYDYYGTKVKSWEITSEEEADDDDLEDIQSDVNDFAEMLGKKLKKVQGAVSLEVEVNLKGEGECDFYFNLIKAGGEWYIASLDEYGF